MSENTETYDFGDGLGPVPAKRSSPHGGWIADQAVICERSNVYDDVTVSLRAILEDSHISGKVRICGPATIRDDSYISGDLEIGRSYLRDVCICASGFIRGGVVIHSSVLIDGDVRIDGSENVAYGKAGMYRWMAYAVRGGGIKLRFGCEAHTLDEWKNLHDELARRHGDAQGAKLTRAVCRYVKSVVQPYLGDD